MKSAYITLAFATIFLSVAALTPTARSQEFTFAVDVPSDLDGATYLANQTVERSQGAYGIGFDGPAEGLDPAVSLDALIVLEDGSFLFSADAPFNAGATMFEARDIVRFSSGSYFPFVAGADLGLPPGANIDAVARDLDGRLLISLASPVSVGGSTYLADDVLRIDGLSLSLSASGQQAGLPQGANVVGLERGSYGDWFFMFDTPTQVGGSTYLPGAIVRYDGNVFTPFFSDPGFPAASMGTDFSFPGSPGDATGLLVDKTDRGLDLSWTGSCSSEVDDYAVYEGAIGSWYSHEQTKCSTSGATTTGVTPEEGDRYFLVVPVNGMFEGSYGSASGVAERPAPAGACLSDQRLAVCPVS